MTILKVCVIKIETVKFGDVARSVDEASEQQEPSAAAGEVGVNHIQDFGSLN